MENKKIEKKVMRKAEKLSLTDPEEIAFLEYQENIRRSKEAKRDRLILVSLSIAIYILGLGIFATIVQTVYQMNEIAGIVLAVLLFLVYSACFGFLLYGIYSKHSFDLTFKKQQKGHYPERTNNKVRWEMAKNIQNQSAVLDYLGKMEKKEYLNKNDSRKVEDFRLLIQLVNDNQNHIPSYKSPDSIALAEALSSSMLKDGVIYKKAKNIVLKKAVTTGCLTALSGNAIMDMSIVAVKNMQMIKDLVWLYGFRPTDYEMNRIMLKVIRNVCLSVGLNSFQGPTNLIACVLKKSGDNFIVQLLSQVFSSSAQFLGNGAMTYLLGKYTIDVLISQYRMQDLFRVKTMMDYQLDEKEEMLEEIHLEIEDELKEPREEKMEIPSSEPLLVEDEKISLFKRLKMKFLKKDKVK